MRALEKACSSIRHKGRLEGAAWLWDLIRPLYEGFLFVGTGGAPRRVINGTDTIRVPMRLRSVSEIYEKDMWNDLMGRVRPGDVVVDVGAHIGLYTVALAKRVGSGGKVFSFEPDRENMHILEEMVRMNRVSDRVVLCETALGRSRGMVPFVSGKASGSHVGVSGETGAEMIRCESLDAFFGGKKMDILKIDVEGYEEEILNGGVNLLSESNNGPAFIYIEAHPQYWEHPDEKGESILKLFKRCGYGVFDMHNKVIEKIDTWRRIVAVKENGRGKK